LCFSFKRSAGDPPGSGINGMTDETGGVSRLDPLGAAEEICRRVTRLQRDAEHAARRFARQAGLTCPRGCGDCCRDSRPHEAALAMLPAAREIITRREERLWMEKAGRNPEGACIFYDPVRDRHCRIYEFRPMICRLFGFAGRLNKLGGLDFRPCRNITGYAGAVAAMPPLYSHYRFRLMSLYPPLGHLLPLNSAFLAAAEWLLLRSQDGWVPGDGLQGLRPHGSRHRRAA
jgi:Fe-S-cluster containining protein